MICFRISVSCCTGVLPSADFGEIPKATWRFRPPTRFMKNSSKLELQMLRKRRRSNKGFLASSASDKTRRLKFNQPTSRFVNSAAEDSGCSSTLGFFLRPEGLLLGVGLSFVMGSHFKTDFPEQESLFVFDFGWGTLGPSKGLPDKRI